VSRIVIAAVGTRGDIGPALFLARRLSVMTESGRGGREVVLVAPPENEAAARSTGAEFRPLGAPFAEVVAAGSLSFYREQIRRQFVDHLDVYRGADLLVGVSLFYAGRSLAEHFDVPYRQVFFTPQVFRSPSTTPPSAHRMSRSAFVNGLLWRRHVAQEDFTVGTVVNAERARLGLSRLRHVADARTGPGTVLAVDPLFARLPEDLAGTGIVQAHYWYHQDETVPVDAATDRFLDAGEPPVMVCFGSADLAMRDAAVMNARACAALAAAGHRVLLVSPKGEADDAGAGTDRAAIHRTAYVPHAKAMPRCRAVIHHGGIGTVFAAARAGVPQLIAPRMLDQFFWADRVSDLRLGYGPIGRADLAGPGVLRALEGVLADVDVACRVCEIRDELAGPARAEAVDEAIVRMVTTA
jgi:UDP:flavonoid glycosyltransferase YjiC (YdhE family)